MIPTLPRLKMTPIPPQSVRWVSLVVRELPPVTEPAQPAALSNISVLKPAPADLKAKRPPKPPQPQEKNQAEIIAPSAPVAVRHDTLPATEPPLDFAIIGEGSIQVSDPNFTFLYYINLIRNRIQKNWQPPQLTSISSPKIQAMVSFNISRSGKISQIYLEQSTSNLAFDLSTQRAIQAVAQLPPLPDEYSGQELKVHIEFEVLR